MVSNWYRRILLLALALVLCPAPKALADTGEDESDKEHYKWALTLYTGPLAQDTIGDVYALQATFPDESYIAVGALTRELWHYRDWFGLEAEGQIGKHFGEMHHWEFNALLDLRWHLFPWDKYVETSFAGGLGLSYAVEVPEVEVADNGESQRLLGYLLFELTLGLPKYPRWDLVVRIHHRSGVFGLFGGVHGGSNYICGGIKYKF